MARRIVIGIDAGSAAVSAVAMDESGELLASSYEFHKGRIPSCVRSCVDALLPEGSSARVEGLARTATAPRFVGPAGEALVVDGRVAEIESLRHFHRGTRTLLVVGAERFARIAFDEGGRYERMTGNSSCAAGTGSFLDQQAARLGLAGGSAELAARAAADGGEYPSIASRCSVFAKTDLIHAQAEGWSVGAICEGLCHGLARNIADTLFPGERPHPPIQMAGGVSRNAAVLRHLSALAGSPISADDRSHLYGAIGACLRFIAAGAWAAEGFAAGQIAVDGPEERTYANGGLGFPSALYPSFESASRFLYSARKNGPGNPVEVDLYVGPESLRGRTVSVLLGLDVGSTSTKAALVAEDGAILAGLYTRTAGTPLEAAQSIFEAVERVESEGACRFEVALAAATGSGRKLAAAVLGFDDSIDEITAHARAAVMLDPEVDTIIEIGGQDSKFTVLSKGRVVFSQMNAVCAAGTGSFLEEQAQRLGVPLSAFSEGALGAPSPLTSDRCTVFMERDLNHLQARGYATQELLAASLFSVCDNYLSKVARTGSIGGHVAFQGATAKNRALVSAFESRLGKPLHVSKFCHLTGAIGAALQARDERASVAPSTFRGFGIHRLDLKSRSERCGLCPNDCRLRIVDVGGEEVAFGFLCGRDYATRHFVGRASSGDALRERSRAIDAAYSESRKGAVPRLGYPSIGIPTALYMADDAPFWQAFFELLGFPTLLAASDAATLREGKRLAGAEFCAPMAMFHGQARALLDRADFAFLPIYLEERPARLEAEDGRGEARRYYCNYSQYASVVTRCAESKDRVRMLSPLIRGRRGDGSMAMAEIRKALACALAPWGIRPPTENACKAAYEACLEAKARSREELRLIFQRRAAGTDIGIVLIGRPYAALSEGMGASIAEIIAKRGIDLAYSDMLPPAVGESDGSDSLLAFFHWRYAAEALEAAEFCARDPRYYPVFITTFKCSPDSFAIEWFRRILDAAGKPYLILQIDEHDSSVGYETRVEAGIRAFRNHFRSARPGDPARGRLVLPHLSAELRGKVVLLPNWDPLVSPLLAANLRGQGIDARALEESPDAIRRAMSGNSGQCIPINIIARECAEYVEREDLDPSRVVLWTLSAMWPCNLPMYPYFIQAALERHGKGMEKIEPYKGDVTFLSVGPRAMIGAYHAFLAGGTLRRLACRTRPYELASGATKRLVDLALPGLVRAFEEGRSKEAAFREAFEPFAGIAMRARDKPKVAIFGDFYARDNDVFNQGLEAAIEAQGGEVVVTPYIDYMKAVLDSIFKRLTIDHEYGEWAKLKAALAIVTAAEKALSLRGHAAFGRPSSWKNPGSVERLARLGIRPEHEGECFDNALKVFRILAENPDVAFFVQANPAFCCPSIVTEAMARELERVTGVPIVSIDYDGNGATRNDAIVPYLAFGPRRGNGP